ncbi:MAG TPA: sortase [Candidatus Saccharimonadales bacterium]|nr:sortase [Candidatus Saccharimonadales bacterium]
MRSAKPELGRQITKPSKFNPDKHWADERYIYRCDTRRGICRRSPINAATSGGSTYFKVINGRSRLSRWRSLLSIGFALMFAVSAILFVYPWLPELDYQLHKTDYQARAGDVLQSQPVGANNPKANIAGNRLIIPKIGVSTAILEGPSLKILDKEEGVWHQTGNMADGNFVLAGHRWRFLPPNTSTLYNLDKLSNGDTVVVDWRGKRLIYTISQVKTVVSTETSILKSDSTKPHITIYTCSDKAQTKRVVVIAEPVAL